MESSQSSKNMSKMSKLSDSVLVMAIVLIFMVNFQCIVAHPLTRSQSHQNPMAVGIVLSGVRVVQNRLNVPYADRYSNNLQENDDDIKLIRRMAPKSVVKSNQRQHELVVKGGSIGDYFFFNKHFTLLPTTTILIIYFIETIP